MRAQSQSRKPAHVEAVILFGLGAVTFAISASDVDEIRDLTGLLPPGANVPCGKVKSRLVREGKNYWVIEGSEHFRMPVSRSTRVLVLRNNKAAVLVDRIDRMAEIDGIVPLPRAFQGEERAWYRGLAILAENAVDRAVPVVRADSFATSVARPEVGAV